MIAPAELVRASAGDGVRQPLDGDLEPAERGVECLVFLADHDDPVRVELAQGILDGEHRVGLAGRRADVDDARGPRGRGSIDVSTRLRRGAVVVLVRRVPVEWTDVRGSDEPHVCPIVSPDRFANGVRIGVLAEHDDEEVLRGSHGQARSATPSTPAVSAQWAQQNTDPSASMPCPTTRQPQWPHTGASAWIAHSKLSKTYVPPR
jgi:hypothetical protein